MRKIKITIFLAIIFFGFLGAVDFASAAPAITGIFGTVSHGSTVTVTGSGFGTKTTAAPLVWDNFEWGQDNDVIAGSHGWVAGGGGIPRIDTSQAYGIGTRSSYYVVDPPEGQQAPESEEFGFIRKAFTESDTVYVSYMARIEQTVSSGSRMWKHGRLVNWSAAPSYNEPPYIGITWWPIEWDSHYDIGNGQVEVFDSTKGGYTPNVWERVEMWIKLLNPGGATNGEMEFWENYYRHTPTNVTVTRTVALGNEKIDSFISPHSYVNAVGGLYEIWMDDVYIDNTKARVEIGNASTWAATTHREIQIPSSWSDTSVTVTLNQGVFANFNSAYLYVIDANGNVNANGYLLSGGADTTPPSAPTGLAVN